VDNSGIASIPDSKAKYPFSKLAVSPRLGNCARFITFPNGFLFESENNDTIDALIDTYGTSSLSSHNSHKIYIQSSLLVMVLFSVWYGVHYGLPKLAQKVTNSIPIETIIEQGQLAYEEMEEDHFTESKLDAESQALIHQRFKEVIPKDSNEFSYRLHIKKSDSIGANAFAFPSGDIVITDALINLTEHEDEVVAILLHEIGHVEKKHAVKSLVQASALLLVVIAVSGDIASTSTLLIGIPALMLNSSYSREMESEADQYALLEMKNRNLDPAHFINILQRLRKQTENQAEDGYFNSHPNIEDRIEIFK
jgi:predicted Zn-dependent protease